MLKQRGDTIIELLLAFTVFTLVSVGALAIMNQGINSAQRSLEVALVKQQIDAQAEALRETHREYGAAIETGTQSSTAWYQIQRNMADSPNLQLEADGMCNRLNGVASRIFIMNARNGTKPSSVSPVSMTGAPASAPPYARVVYSGNNVSSATGIWIEKTTKPAGHRSPAATDLTIKACWYGPGQTAPMQLQTVLRLYNYDA